MFKRAVFSGLGLVVFAFPALSLALTPPPPSDDYGTGPISVGIYCPQLSTTMQRGARDASTGGQVSELQAFLTDYFDLDENIVVGGYFGKLTQHYLIQFQNQQGLPAFGIAGSLTRAKIAEVCGGTITQPPPPPGDPVVSVSLQDPTGQGKEMFAIGDALFISWTTSRPLVTDPYYTTEIELMPYGANPATTSSIVIVRVPAGTYSYTWHVTPSGFFGDVVASGRYWVQVSVYDALKGGYVGGQGGVIGVNFGETPPPPSRPVSLMGPVTVTVGQAFPASWEGGESTKDWIAVVPRGQGWSTGLPWFWVTGPTGTGTLTGPLDIGLYDFVYYRGSDFFEGKGPAFRSAVSVDVREPSVGHVYLVPARRVAEPKASIAISWKAAGPYQDKDWITVLPTGQTSWKEGNTWFYTDGLSRGRKIVTLPATPGVYDIVYFYKQNNTPDAAYEVARSVGAIEIKASLSASAQAVSDQFASALSALEQALQSFMQNLGR